MRTHYVPDSSDVLHLRLFEYRPGARELVLWSALGRYIVFNLQIGPFWLELRQFLFGRPAMAAPRYSGNTSTDTSEIRVRDSLRTIDAFFRDLPDLVGLAPDRVLFTMDGFRYPEQATEGSGTYFDLMRKAFASKAKELGYEILDLDTFFFERHRRTKVRFEYPNDGHWNSIGHEVAFRAIESSDLLRRLRQ